MVDLSHLHPDWGDQLDVRYYLAEKLSALKEKKVLDIGCGKGYLLSVIPDSCEKFGIDINPESLNEARSRNPSADIRDVSMLELPFADGKFDVVYMANTLPHADFSMPGVRQKDQETAIFEAARVLKKGGTFYLTTPNNARYHSIKETYEELDALLAPHFAYQIRGWNPFPNWPYFAPGRALARVPGWYALLKRLCESGRQVRRGKFFFVHARRR
ncbi:class I SAM-dependent methyltransferase [Candidatus Micrarchaeota archaeon]|nr:class I SAM-dependent methyltransferase [Candidatus Micrarchaeota archaeon]